MSTHMFKNHSIDYACRAVGVFGISMAGFFICLGRLELQADESSCIPSLVAGTDAGASQREYPPFKARCISSYQGGHDSIEVDRGGDQSRLKIDVRKYPRFYYANGNEIANPQRMNVVVRFNQNIYITYQGNTIVKIQYAD